MSSVSRDEDAAGVAAVSGTEFPKQPGSKHTGACRVPPPQRPVELALALALDAVRSDPPAKETLDALGAAATHEGIRLPLLNRHVVVKPEGAGVLVEGDGEVSPGWAVLVLHYLRAEDVSLDAREVSLAHFPDCRGYVVPFTKRVIGRFLRTIGKTSESFSQASERLGGTRVSGPGLAYRFDVLPRVPITLILFEGDDELAASANVLFRADAQRLLPAGTVIAAAELLVGALCGSPIERKPGEADEKRD